MNSPKFSRDLYNKHDTPAKQNAKRFFKTLGFTPLTETEEYYSKFDFQMTKQSKTFSVETEIKTCWYNPRFPFNSLDVAGRKSKSTADWFIQFNCDYTALAVCPMNVVHNSKTYRKNTKYSEDELFYAVDLNQVNFYHKQDTRWVLQTYNNPLKQHFPTQTLLDKFLNSVP